MIDTSVTVIMATYNGENYLREQLDSIINQTYKNFSLVVHDDLSSDRTWDILKEYAEKYDSITIGKNKKRLGVVKNFQNLIEYSSSEYIALCDQDDIWDLNKLEIAIENLEKNKKRDLPMLFHSDLRVVNKNNQLLFPSYFKMRGYYFPAIKSLDILLGRSGVMGNTIVMNQALKKEILPFPMGLSVHDYWIGLINEIVGKRITYREPLVSYRLHNDNTSNSYSAVHQNSFLRIFQKLRLPYHESNREVILKQLLNKYRFSNKEKKIILDFLLYLEFNTSRLKIISIVLKYNIFREGSLYKLKLVGAILWKKK